MQDSARVATSTRHVLEQAVADQLREIAAAAGSASAESFVCVECQRSLPAGRFHRHCWHLDRLAAHLAAVARRSGAVREVFAAGLVWVSFRVLGHLLADGALELVGKVLCSCCGDGPLTVSAPAGDWSRLVC